MTSQFSIPVRAYISVPDADPVEAEIEAVDLDGDAVWVYIKPAPDAPVATIQSASREQALAHWLCTWWDSDETDDHHEEGTPFPCILCIEQARALVIAVRSGKIEGLTVGLDA